MTAENPELSPTTGRIFDRHGVAIHGTSSGRRTTTCWRWADNARIRVIDEHLAWGGTASEERPPELEDAIRECVTERSVLIVYSLNVISEDPAIVEQVRQELGTLPIQVAADTPEAEGRVPQGGEQEDEAS